jgi:hypothetical protein
LEQTASKLQVVESVWIATECVCVLRASKRQERATRPVSMSAKQELNAPSLLSRHPTPSRKRNVSQRRARVPSGCPGASNRVPDTRVHQSPSWSPRTANTAGRQARVDNFGNARSPGVRISPPQPSEPGASAQHTNTLLLGISKLVGRVTGLDLSSLQGRLDVLSRTPPKWAFCSACAQLHSRPDRTSDNHVTAKWCTTTTRRRRERRLPRVQGGRRDSHAWHR